ncbi:MAG: alpha/beta fold hydrolase [Desulfobacterales bacterium]
MAKDFMEEFLSAATVKRLEMAREDANAEALTAYLGQAAYNEYRRIAAKLDMGHLGIQSPKNLIFVPGIMGSLLLSKTKGGVWWIDVRTRGHINDLALAPDGRQDADPANQIAPFSTDPSYEPFLTAVLARDDFGHEVFAYDWRKALHLSAGALKDLVHRLYGENGNRPVHLVAHSMGGLMVRAALLDYGPELWPEIGRVVFIGTPHYGSPAIAGYLKNHLWGFELMALLGLYLSRETFRSMWGTMSMLPAPRGIYPGTRPQDALAWTSGSAGDAYQHPCVNFDLYQTKNWALDLTPSQDAALQNILDHTAEFHRRMDEAHRSLDQAYRDRMLVIAGVGYKTLFRLAYEPRFFGLWEKMMKTTERIPADLHRDGDGRVPLASATLYSTPIRYVKGVHGGLPNIPAVYKEVFHWFKQEDLELPGTPHAALSDHLAADEAASEAPHLDGTIAAKPFSDDAGLWDVADLAPERVTELQVRLAAEQLSEFSRVRLL